MSNKKTIGFTGSRNGFQNSNLVKIAAQSCARAGHSIAVGCARGVDSIVRQAVPSAKVFQVASAGCGTGRSVAAALAQRSQFMVSSCSILVGFASVACPAGLTPSSHFSGQGSGTWSSIAFAISQGLQVFVFVAPGVSLPSWPGGQWVQACPSGFWSQAFSFQPSAVQLSIL